MSVVLGRRALAFGVAGLALGARSAHAAGGSAVLVIDADPPTLNLGITTDYTAGDVSAKILEGLVWTDRSYAAQPSLATSWTVSPDGLEYTFTLRDGVKWHDGAAFTADDVVFSFTEILGKLHPRASAMLRRLAAVVSAPSPTSVTFKLKTPYAPFLQQFSVFDAPILPKHLYAGTDIAANPANQHPIGTGPFKFNSWARGSAITVVRNPDYWGAPKPGLDRIVFQIIPQPASRITALETGDADFAPDFYLPKAGELQLLAGKALQVRQAVNIPAVYFAIFNTETAPFSDIRARHAVAQAVDRSRMVRQVMNGLATPGFGAFGDGFGWLTDADSSYNKLYPLHPAAAKALLTDSGFKPDTKPRVLYDAARPQMVSAANILRENLRAIGMDVQLVPLERSVLNDRLFVKRDFEIALQSYFSAGDPAIGYHRMYQTDTSHAVQTNASGYSNPEIDKLLGDALSEPDRPKRAELYRQAQRILNVDIPSFVLFDEKTVNFASKRLTGIWPGLAPRDQWAGVSIAT
jgi:peptide/nickel transport system substrate-binding protein